MNKPQNQNLFSPYPSTDFNCWSSHPFTYLTPIKDPPLRAEFPRLDHNVGSTLPWGTNYDWNDRCPYPSTYFNRWTPHPFTYLTPKKGPPFRAEPPRLDHNVGSTLPPGELSIDWNDRCPYPSTYFNCWTRYPFMYLEHEKGPPSGRSLPV